MEVYDIENIMMLFLLFTPGFIALKSYELIIPGEKLDITKSLTEIFFYTFVNYLIWSWLLWLVFGGKWNLPGWAVAVILVFVMFISPILLTFLWKNLRNVKFFKRKTLSPYVTAWDYYFCKKKGAWVIIKLTDGAYIGGVFGKNSFASLHEDVNDIYIQEVWCLNDQHQFEKKIERSDGAYIKGNNIQLIQFFN